MVGARRLVLLLLCLGLSGLFLYAGVLKLLRPDQMLTDILSYQLVPYQVAWFAALVLPAVEIITAVALWIGSLRREAVWMIWGMMAVFIVALALAWGRGLDISCGCFGKSETEANYPWLIGRDVLIALTAGGVYLLDRNKIQG